MSLELTDKVYDVTAHFPKDEIYGLSSQLRRSAVSIASNIVEGAGRNGRKEFIQAIGIARGSLAELETQLIIAHRRKYVADTMLDDLTTMIEKISKMLFKLQQSLKEPMPI